MRFVIVKELAFGLLIANLLTRGDCNSYLNETWKNIIRRDYENAYTLIENAETEERIVNATLEFRETGPNDAYMFEPSNIFSDLALFHCALKVSRMFIDNMYTQQIKPGATTLPSSPNADEAAIAKDWSDYMDSHREEEGLAHEIRQAYVYQQEFDADYQARWSKTLARVAKLFRRFEGKIREIIERYDRHREKYGATNKIGLYHVFKNYSDEWNFTHTDLYCVNRIRHAEKVKMITFNWLDVDNKTVIPYCVQW